MYVGEGSVTDLIDWFRQSSDARFLGLFAAGDATFDKFLDDVIKQSETIDVILGSQIDLFLVGGNQTITVADPGKELTIKASPLTAIRQHVNEGFRPQITHPQITHVSQINLQAPQVKKKIKKATTLSTHEFSKLLDLEVDDLPGLVLIGSHLSENFVLKIRGATDAEFIIEFFRSVRKALEKIERSSSTGRHITNTFCQTGRRIASKD